MPAQSEESRELPRYKSHKEVWALKIKAIVPAPDPPTEPAAMIIPEEPGYAPFPVTAEYMRKHNPKVGGYWVRYKDGYESYSPAPQFEEGNTLIN